MVLLEKLGAAKFMSFRACTEARDTQSAMTRQGWKGEVRAHPTAGNRPSL